MTVSDRTKKWAWALGVFLAVSALSAGTYWNVLSSPDEVLAFNDGNIEALLSPTYQFPAAIARVWDNGTFLGLAAKQYPITLTALGESIGPVFWRRWGQMIVLGLCALAFYWSLRQYRIERLAAALAAAILAGSGACQNFSMSGLAVRPMAMACTALALGFVEHGRISRRWLPYAIGGGCLGLGIAEVPDVGVLYALTTAVIFWWTHLFVKTGLQSEGHAAEPPTFRVQSSIFSLLGKFVLYVACSGLLAWQTIGTMFSTQIQGVTQGTSETREDRYAWATQWSVPPAEMWNTVAGNYFGCSMRSENSPYWGRIGRDLQWDQTHQGFRNFTMTGWHLGVVPCILALVLVGLLWRRRDERDKDGLLPGDAWLWLVVILGIVAMMLMWGRYFPLYRLFWSLPLFGTFRNPEKWNGPFTLCVGLGVAFLLQALWRSLTGRDGRQQTATITLWKTVIWTSLGMAVVGLFIGLGTLANHDGFVAARLAEEYGPQAELMWDNAVAASFKVAVLAGLVAVIAWWVLRCFRGGRVLQPAVVISMLAVLALGDQFFDNRGYGEGHRYRQYLEPNPLTDFLDGHRTEGRIKLLPPRHPLLNNLRLTLLQMKGYDLFDPVSVSRMPSDYATLFQTLEKQPVRLWEMGAMRYFLTLPGAVEQANQMDGNRGRFVERLGLSVSVVDGGYVPVNEPELKRQILRVVEFSGALPKYRFAGSVHVVPPGSKGDRQALDRLRAADFQPAQETLIHADLTASDLAAHGNGRITVLEETPVRVKLEVEATAPGWLVRSAKFDPDWKVTVDGQIVELVRADYLFQAVRVSDGKHLLELRYEPSLQSTCFAAVNRMILLLLLACFVVSRKTAYVVENESHSMMVSM